MYITRKKMETEIGETCFISTNGTNVPYIPGRKSKELNRFSKKKNMDDM